jgi:hypothetical protein
LEVGERLVLIRADVRPFQVLVPARPLLHWARR